MYYDENQSPTSFSYLSARRFYQARAVNRKSWHICLWCGMLPFIMFCCGFLMFIDRKTEVWACSPYSCFFPAIFIIVANYKMRWNYVFNSVHIPNVLEYVAKWGESFEQENRYRLRKKKIQLVVKKNKIKILVKFSEVLQICHISYYQLLALEVDLNCHKYCPNLALLSHVKWNQ